MKVKSKKQLNAIRYNYAKKSNRTNQPKKSVPSKSTTPEIPLKQGGLRWGVFNSKDYQVKSASMKGSHPFLVIDEENNCIVGLSMTTSEGRSGHSYIEMRNIIDNKNPKSHFEKDLKYQNKAKRGKLLSKKALIDKINKMDLSLEEKERILKSVNSVESNKIRYLEFKEKSKK